MNRSDVDSPGQQGPEAAMPQSPVDVSDLTPAQAERVLGSLALLGCLFVLLIALIIGGVAAWKVFMPRPSSLPVLPLTLDVTLTDASLADASLPSGRGADFGLAERRGRIVLFAVLPAACPAPCPVLAHQRDVLTRLGPDAARVQAATVIEPPAGPAAAQSETAAVSAAVGVTQRLSAGALYLIDDLGRARSVHGPQADAGDIVREVRELLREARGR